MGEIRVIVIDELAIVRAGVRSILEAAGGIRVVAEVESAERALWEVTRARPDVAVIDVTQGSGVQLLQEVRSRRPEMRVIVLTMSDADETLFGCILAGVSAYLIKRLTAAELVRAVRTVAAGKSLLDPAITAAVLEQVRASRRRLVDKRLSRLSVQEARVLALLAGGKTNRDIAAQLGLSIATVKNHVASILAKLEVGRRGEAAAYLADHRRRGGRWPLD